LLDFICELYYDVRIHEYQVLYYAFYGPVMPS